MELYETLAVRMRPKTLEELVGQDQIRDHLHGMFTEKRIARSFLISGVFGTGKTTVARIVARYVNCVDENKSSIDPCMKCWSCEAWGFDSHPDVHEINASDARGIDDVRSWIDSARLSPRSKYRVYIIDECHQMTTQAQNAFLKILEEPPAKTIFILCTTVAEKLLPTIMSRCVKLSTNPVDAESMTAYLVKIAKLEGFTLDFGSATTIANLTRGHMRDALQGLEALINVLRSRGQLQSVESIVPEVLEAFIQIPPEALVRKFLIHIYKGKYTGALRSVKNAPNPEIFVQTAIEFHTQTLYNFINRELLCDPYYKTWFDDLLKEEVVVDVNWLAKSLSEMVSTLYTMRQYLIEPKTLLIGLTAKLVASIKE